MDLCVSSFPDQHAIKPDASAANQCDLYSIFTATVQFSMEPVFMEWLFPDLIAALQAKVLPIRRVIGLLTPCYSVSDCSWVAHDLLVHKLTYIVLAFKHLQHETSSVESDLDVSRL